MITKSFLYFILFSSLGISQSKNETIIINANKPYPYNWNNQGRSLIICYDSSIVSRRWHNSKYNDVSIPWYNNSILDLEINSDGKLLISQGAGTDGTVILATLNYSQKKIDVLGTFSDMGEGIWLNTDSTILLCGKNSIYECFDSLMIYNPSLNKGAFIAHGSDPSFDHIRSVIFVALSNVCESNGLREYNINTKEVIVITKDQNDESPSLSNDGRWLVFLRNDHLWLMDRKTKELEEIITEKCYRPKFNPYDGTLWVWRKTEDSYLLVRVKIEK